MSTLREIVDGAYRESGIIQIGTSADSEQLAEAMDSLKRLIASLYGNEMGEPLRPLPVGNEGVLQAYARAYDQSSYLSSYFVPPNSQLVVNGSQAYTVYLNPQPMDGERVSVLDVSENFDTNAFTIDGNGRRIGDDRTASITEAGSNRSWFYRADLGKWVEVTNLTPDSESPFPVEFDDFLITSLAMRLFPRYQQQTSPETVQTYKRSKSQFRARYRQVIKTYPEMALVRLSANYPHGYSYTTLDNYHAFSYGDII